MVQILREDRLDQSIQGIVFLDADGVIIPSRSSWQTVRELLETEEQGKEHYNQYSNGEISFSEWGEKDAKLWEGEPISAIESEAQEIDPMNGLYETIDRLHDLELAVGVISTGVYQVLKPIAEQSGLDFIIANELEVKEGRLTGHVNMDVTDSTKPEYVHLLSEAFSVPMCRTIAVGDTRHDINKFNTVGLSIAFNPSSAEVRQEADTVIEELDLRLIVPPISKWLESKTMQSSDDTYGTFQRPDQRSL